jgi:hypothetical protein
MWHRYTMEFYSAIKKNEILLFAGKWLELGIIVLSERSQAHKYKYSMFSSICGICGGHESKVGTTKEMEEEGGRKENKKCDRGESTLHTCVQRS